MDLDGFGTGFSWLFHVFFVDGDETTDSIGSKSNSSGCCDTMSIAMLFGPNRQIDPPSGAVWKVQCGDSFDHSMRKKQYIAHRGLILFYHRGKCPPRGNSREICSAHFWSLFHIFKKQTLMSRTLQFFL